MTYTSTTWRGSASGALGRAGHLISLPVAGGQSQRDRQIRRLLMASDVIALTIGLLVLGLTSTRPALGEAFLLGLPTLPAWLLVFGAYGLYRRDQTRIGHTTVDDVPWLFHAMTLGCLLMWVYYRWLPGDDHFGKILAFGLACAGSVLALRSLARRFGARLVVPERLLLVGGDDEEMQLLAGKLKSHPGYGVELIGEATTLGPETDLDLAHLAHDHGLDRIVVSQAHVDESALLELLRECKKFAIKVSVLPRLSDVMGPSVEVDEVAGLTLIGITPPILSSSARAAKRGLDIVGATILLVLTAPVMALIALAIKLDSSGPVLFRQQRVGHRGELFEMLKFRTMVPDAEQRRGSLISQSLDPGWLHLEEDPRITRIGRMLRRRSLDELPQLWNVLRGQMSLVGPRPLIPSEDASLVGWARTRLDLVPGLSGLWQVLGRTSIPFQEMIKLDYLYVTNWSLWGDIRLILRTVPAVIMRRGAN